MGSVPRPPDRKEMRMASAATTAPGVDNLADPNKQPSGGPPKRIRANPPPGTATEKDVTRIERREKRLYELVDGVLVEKVMGFLESVLTLDLAGYLREYLRRHKLGLLAGADGTLRLMPGLVR